jgi:hypothetical protein
MVGPAARAKKNRPEGGSSHRPGESDFRNLIGFQTRRADLHSQSRSIEDGFHANDVCLELPQSPHTDVLPCSTLLLRLTFAGDIVPSGRSLAANIASSCHKKSPSENSRGEHYHRGPQKIKGHDSLSILKDIA